MILLALDVKDIMNTEAAYVSTALRAGWARWQLAGRDAPGGVTTATPARDATRSSAQARSPVMS
jgi:hypothetical protein